MRRPTIPERLALILAGIGVALATLIVLLLGLGEILVAFASQIASGVGVIFAAAFVLGRLLPRFVGDDPWSAMAVGGGLAGAVLVLGTLAGATLGLGLAPDGFAFGVGAGLFDWVAKPLYWILLVGGLPALGLGAFWGHRVRRDHAAPQGRGPRRRAATVATALLAMPVLVAVLGLGRTERVTHPMRWGFESAEAEAAARVTLVFVEHPHHFQTFESRELLSHLRETGPTTEVTFVVKRDFGRVRSIAVEAIGAFGGDPGSIGGGRGCGREPLAPCSETEARSPW